jgi:hypothetical protein
MKYLLILTLLSCVTPDKELAQKRLKASKHKTEECITSGDRDRGLTVCIDGPDLIFCNRDECLVYAPH